MLPARWPTRFGRLPIRARLTVVFIGVMALVLGAAGLFLYGQFRDDLDDQLDSALRVQATGVEALIDAGGPAAVASSGAPMAQIFAADGRLVAAAGGAAGPRLLTVAEARRAARVPLRIERRPLPFGAGRIQTTPARRRRLAIAVVMPLALRDHELDRLRTLLLVAGPLALLLSGVAGYQLARAALRPVERMRSQAEQITDRDLSERLPVVEPPDEIGLLSRTLNAMLGRVEASVRRERRLVSDASHELRTPLTTLRAEVDLALIGERDAAELRAALASAAEEAKRMSRLADDLLVLARVDDGRLPIHPKQLAPVRLLKAAASRAQAAAELRGRMIVVRDESLEGASVIADPDRTAQALSNLITNALQYGGGTITLSVSADRELIELHVTDDGPGFPEELLGRAFERFGRGEQARGNEPGSGLGLALVEAVARAQGGSAGARNATDGGADVWIALPRA
jgi:signal transduction histidine kinase